MDALETIVRLLAQNASVQQSYFPSSFLPVGEELALDWESAYLQASSRLNELPPATYQHFKALDAYFERLSGNEEYFHLWFDPGALIYATEWVNIRLMANEIIQTMCWDASAPARWNTRYIVSTVDK